MSVNLMKWGGERKDKQSRRLSFVVADKTTGDWIEVSDEHHRIL